MVIVEKLEIGILGIGIIRKFYFMTRFLKAVGFRLEFGVFFSRLGWGREGKE